MKAHVFIAQSLDGFIADKYGSIEFLKIAELKNEDPSNQSLISEDFGYSEFMAKTDCLVMGRKTWEKIKEFDFWPYEKTDVIVLSKNKFLPIAQETFYDGSIDELWQELKSRHKTHVYIDGGKVIQSFLAKSLVSTMTITTLPILLGGGTRLFGDLTDSIHCKLEKITSYPNGVSQSLYGIVSKS